MSADTAISRVVLFVHNDDERLSRVDWPDDAIGLEGCVLPDGLEQILIVVGRRATNARERVARIAARFGATVPDSIAIEYAEPEIQE
jgi:hypothetical protein